MADHPNSTADDNINPTSGTENVNNGDDPEKTAIQNRIQKNQGVEGPNSNTEPDIRADSLKSADTTSTAT